MDREQGRRSGVTVRFDDTRPSTASRAEPQHWGQPYWDEDHAGHAAKLLAAADAMLLGRVTYEGFKDSWSVRDASSPTRSTAIA
jgi:hypothetical protein